MFVVASEAHRGHDPRTFLVRGRLGEPREVPERAERLLRAAHGAGHTIVAPRAQDDGMLGLVHTPDYLDFLAEGHAAWRALPEAGPEIVPNVHPNRAMETYPKGIVGRAGWHMADTACPLGEGTWAAARASAGLALTAADLVLDGAAVAYALCRPPGHHAFPDMAGGFCFLNNVAIAAERCVARLGHVAILDVDVHHGNGTQACFYDRRDVFFASIHGDPANFYPYFAGHAHERGAGAGLGTTLNLPLPPRSGDEPWLAALDRALGAIRRFAPRLILVSLGLDAQAGDPLGILDVSAAGFRAAGARIAALGLPTVLVQEGGYLCPGLETNLAAFLAGFEGRA
jgi:acetoin utilization deacetylase AcuC-like enzyme